MKPIIVNKYKLIYYSPQLLPSPVYEKSTTTFTISQNEPIFIVGDKNGSIYLHTPKNEPVLEYLCRKKMFCSCLSCIFSLNIIYSNENRINAETIRVFIDDFNDFSPKFYESVININISESSKIGETFQLLNAGAFDGDVFYNKVIFILDN